MTVPILELKNVSKSIGGKKIIDRLNFEVPRGEIFGFLGPNGAGKTTTIRMIVGLMRMSAGDILIDGRSIATDFERAIVNVGAIVENPELYKYLTGYQNLIHFARMVPGISKQRIDEVVKLVGMENRVHDPVRTYSLGMRQRLGLAQALLRKPQLLILDEPTNGLDPAGIRELRDYLRKLTREENITVLVSSHLLSEMELMCDRVAIIQHGKLIDVKSISDLMEIGNDGKVKMIFEIDAVEAALETLIQQPTVEAMSCEEGIEMLLNREETSAVIDRLVKANVPIYSVRKAHGSLEDKFLEMTRGGQIV